MIYRQILSACLELSKIAETAMSETFSYRKVEGIRSTPTMSDCTGILTLARIAVHGNDRFDFDPVGIEAVVFEAMGEDGETPIDLVAWPIDCPWHVLTMFGRCGLIGAFCAFNPATYCAGSVLPIYRSPHELFRCGFNGSAIAVPHIAAWQIIDLPGRVVAQDLRHGIQLQRLIERNFRGRVTVPANARWAA
ncbi:hypothetical protein PZ897_05860 [Hoeflea sp. YIM 152468]|uniref:hypothetical protein n=1 Tax=Hoeflea sp. YIM 152468 TaxID=3031759 RepID=UPI0023DBCF60|nr:hypothetical protein [Hoeflea sp. YIM 152468]MDF1607698.1 hypothetical protein [Hoeflea sp. YIM 152468]